MILVTGAAGFIGFHVARRLLDRGEQVVGVDNLNSYYDPLLKQARLAQLEERGNFAFRRLDLADRQATAGFFDSYAELTAIVHLAARRGSGIRSTIPSPTPMPI